MSVTQKLDPIIGSEPPPAGTPGGEMHQRGGRVDIEDGPGEVKKSKVEEAAEESFPASDSPCFTPAGYCCAPPPSRK